MEGTKQTRRRILGLTGALAVAGLGTAGSAISRTTDASSSHEDSITFGKLRPKGEWLVLHNEGNDDLDISGFKINFEFGQTVDQIREFREEFGATMIAAGGSITVAT